MESSILEVKRNDAGGTQTPQNDSKDGPEASEATTPSMKGRTERTLGQHDQWHEDKGIKAMPAKEEQMSRAYKTPRVFIKYGDTRGKLTVVGLGPQYPRGTKNPHWLCRCQCGAIDLFLTSSLNNSVSAQCRRCRRSKTQPPIRQA